MATIEEYTTGKVCRQLKSAFSIMDTARAPLKGSDIGNTMLANVKKLMPRKISLDQAIELIEASENHAIGPRVCLAVHKDARTTESVFLNDLAAGMIDAGKARPATKEEAISALKKYARMSIIISKVSGQYSEICPSWPQRCLYWNMERHGLKCIER